MAKRRLLGEHAVVLGASMGGLAAARALHGWFERVTIIERDALPLQVEQRKGVPQGQHTHGLLPRGVEVLEDYFPGLTAELTASGAVSLEGGLDVRWINDGRRARPCSTGWIGVGASRPLLEGTVRRRVAALDGLEILERTDALGLTTIEGGGRINGVRSIHRQADSAEQVLSADLVVDATGRGSRSPMWLEALGYAVPEENSVRVGIGYATRLYRRSRDHLDGDGGVVIAANPPNPACGVALAQEHDRWIVTLIGYLGEYPPTDPDGFLSFAARLPSPDLYALIREATPIGDAVATRYPASVRHRYERLRRFPERYVVFGDALCSFNPIYGQGITVAAVQATMLEQTLSKGLDRIGRRFFSAASKAIDIPWSLAVGNDLRFSDVEGKRGSGVRFVHWYMNRFHGAAAVDPALTRWFLAVAGLKAPPSALFRPDLAARVFVRSMSGRTKAAVSSEPHDVMTRRRDGAQQVEPGPDILRG